MLARYNRIANERLYEKCAELDDSEYRRVRRGSFGSIHGLLNHILLGDRINGVVGQATVNLPNGVWMRAPPAASGTSRRGD